MTPGTVRLLGGPHCGEPTKLDKPAEGPPEYIDMPQGRYLRAHHMPPWMRQWVPGGVIYLWERLYVGAL